MGSDDAGKDNLVDNINLTNPHYRLNIILIIAHTGPKINKIKMFFFHLGTTKSTSKKFEA